MSAKGEPRTGGFGNVWVRREKGRFPFWRKPSAPIRLTTGPISFGYLYPSADGRRLLTAALAYEQRELLRPSEDKKLLLPVLQTSDIHAASLSPKGNWLAVILSEWTLWRIRPDGTERTQLATQFRGAADKPKWSPDGSRIVFQGREEGRPPNIYVVNAEGGPSQELLPSDRNHESPDWSPDGKSVVYVTPWFRKEDSREDSGIFVLNLQTRISTRLPESEGMMDPRFSLDGRYLAAFSQDQKRVMLFDFQTHDWKEIAHGKVLNHLDRTPNADYFYFQDVFDKGAPIYRLRVGSWKVERVMSFESSLGTGFVRCRLIGLSQGGSPMVLGIRGGYDIYALDLDLP